MAREQRRLAAIVAADVAGYSRLMGHDESGTLAALKALRREVVDPKIDAHNGRIVKTTGDGLLLEFPSVVDAVRCVIEVQNEMTVRGANDGEDRRIAFRVGVNLGDVIVDGDDIFGDGVNVAARLEALAEPGGICLSDDAVRQIRGKIEATFDDIGVQSLKNIAQAVRVWRWASGASASTNSNSPLALPDKPSIAVLPFQNMSGDPEQEYFADGIVEDIITALSRTKVLFVISRNSSFSYKGKSPDIRQVGRDLGVRYVLEGSVRKGGGRLRITGQLIDATTGAHVWADRFEGSVDDVFELQDSVSSTVVGCLMPNIEKAEIERSIRKTTTSLQAYDYVLRGRALSARYTNDANNEAYDLFRKAFELDPSFALAYAYAAGCFAQRKAWGWPIKSPADEAEQATRLAEKALELERADPRILALVGWVFQTMSGRHSEGEALTALAVERDPNFFVGWNLRGWATLATGNPNGLGYFLQALRLSPLHPVQFGVHSGIATAHFLMKDYDKAIEWGDKVLKEYPSQMLALFVRAAALALTGRLDQARRDCTAIRQINPNVCVSKLLYWVPVAREEIIDDLKRGLRLGGLPE